MNTDISRDAVWREELRTALTAKERTSIPRVVMPQLPADFRVKSNHEVNQGLSQGQAVLEASRCLDCPDPSVFKAARYQSISRHSSRISNAVKF